ncbi:YkgJ family cysteine cluster protein [Acidiferrimicrobium sp. IK]|uniref:YkgJ family cysteine cluster protein n=1 Tax=Acidiferrimicrobium sp. IK TaxID=2871700 RepID=UPI0021CB5EF7|nr:YkgJ family cysteine cluster protein [Acidiferrimicrobium sp. IK]MCU4184578.1 YkgJ family cysteine cluster protein [Acidiferrimicrobium sp. IK]
MTGSESNDVAPSDAGAFSDWLAGMRAALTGAAESDVACQGCRACCSSSQFVHVGPDESDTLAHIPPALRFPAPGLPPGHVVLGYDEQGRCPMLTDQGCGIYAHRPRTCRTYDCRVFSAADVEPEDPDKAAIAVRVKGWQWRYPSPGDQEDHRAVQAAARWLEVNGAQLGALGPRSATQRSVMAVELSDLWRAKRRPAGGVTGPDVQEVRAELSRRRR